MSEHKVRLCVVKDEVINGVRFVRGVYEFVLGGVEHVYALTNDKWLDIHSGYDYTDMVNTGLERKKQIDANKAKREDLVKDNRELFYNEGM